MILAAGRGERMHALTNEVPKPLLRVGRQSLIERHLTRLPAAGIERVVVNLSYRGDQIRAALGDGRRYGVAIDYSPEPEPPLETAGGIVRALPKLGDGPFLLVNADVLTDFEFARLRGLADDGALVLVPNPPHNESGDFGLTADGRATLAPPRLTFAGISILHTELFASLSDGRRPLKPILDAAIDQGRLRALRHDGLWLDVGTPERLEQARTIIEQLEPTE